MAYLLGIDIGTSSVKALLLDSQNAAALATATQEYPVHQPQPGYAEQNPSDWWNAVTQTVRKVISQSSIDASAIQGIGLSGQMHGFVCMGRDNQPVRPAIIWADARSKPQVDDLRARIDVPTMAQVAPGLPAAGFMGPSLMWLSQHEPETLEKTEVVLLPKDYVRLRLTGSKGTDPTDAAATWLFDVQQRQWSAQMASWCGLEDVVRLLPEVDDSAEVVGTTTAEAANALGIPAGIPVIAGCADQCSQALGYGLTNPGTALVTVGTGGQVFVPLAESQPDPQLRYYVFNHAFRGHWYAAAATLAAGLSLRWLRDTLGLKDRPDAYAHLSQIASETPPGANGLVFLPHLIGERTPHMDPQASGLFLGLRLHHHAGHMARAIMEGVAFTLRECLTLVSASEKPQRVIATGGATASPLWRQIQADIYGYPLHIASGENHACTGAALLAGVGCGLYTTFDEAAALLPQPTEIIQPDVQRAAFYSQRQDLYNSLYHKLKEDMHRLAAETSAQ